MTGELTAKVLVIDDSAPTREFLHTWLTSAGCQVITASSGVGVVPLVERQKPDLVLLDIVMPGIDGLEVCRQLKEDVATRDVTVILVSGLLHQANVRRAREVGANAYMWKPFNEEELLSVVYAALDRRRGTAPDPTSPDA
ncbi:MAG: response regulator [Acidobacteria bacterium]|nr:response regulator [Acidobacteriota bacterium]